MISPPGQDPEASIQLASGSDVGQLRSANEDSCDSFTHEDGTRLLVLADGMGGARGGATASHTAIATIAEHFERDTSERPRATLETAIQAANARIFEIAQRDPELEGMGTTVVALLLDARLRATVAHVGDSRAYLIRDSDIKLVTRDHSLLNDYLEVMPDMPPEQVEELPRNVITRALGMQDVVTVDIQDLAPEAGDRWLLCSDGLNGMLKDEQILAEVMEAGADLEAGVNQLIERANAAGGEDNTTVVLCGCQA